MVQCKQCGQWFGEVVTSDGSLSDHICISQSKSTPAYPTTAWQIQPPMTLRQWYAGLAMLGLIAGNYTEPIKPEDIAAEAIEQADAMIEEEGKR